MGLSIIVYAAGVATGFAIVWIIELITDNRKK